jgi:hypothetical protein
MQKDDAEPEVFNGFDCGQELVRICRLGAKAVGMKVLGVDNDPTGSGTHSNLRPEESGFPFSQGYNKDRLVSALVSAQVPVLFLNSAFGFGFHTGLKQFIEPVCR